MSMGRYKNTGTRTLSSPLTFWAQNQPKSMMYEDTELDNVDDRGVLLPC